MSVLAQQVFRPILTGIPLGPTIGNAGTDGFGVGIAPGEAETAGYVEMTGTRDRASPNYGNYRYVDGSVMCFIPAFYYRIGSAASPRYAVHGGNAIDVLPYSAFADVAAANAAGYALHRAFYDGGAIKAGFFVDKYQCSNNAGTASSIALGAPLSTNSGHNPIGALTGAPANNYGGTIDATKTRGAQFFPCLRYQHTALALLATAHGQAATSADACAWYDAGGNTNFPKGNNNNNFSDSNDGTLAFTHDGYAGGNSALSGSGAPFAKTTHNGQACGVADLNGNLYDTSIGVTCVAGSKAITARSQSNPATIMVAGHGLASGDQVLIIGDGNLDNRMFAVAVVDANTLALPGVDSSAWAAYPGGATLVAGTFYMLSTAARAADLTSGNSGATDAWGAVGVAAHSAPIPPVWRTDYPENSIARRLGNGTEPVFSPAVDGEAWLRTAAGWPLAGSGASGGGSALFGQDYFYQYVRNELCPLAGFAWNDGSYAGVWGVRWSSARTYSSAFVVFRAASYLD